MKMKKNIFSILMLLLLVTAAWAGEGDGSKDHPFSGVWQASQLASRIDKGKNLYLAYDCDIQNGTITVTDSKLNNTVIVNGWPAWSPGNVLGSSNYSGYSEYYRNNSLDDRKSQLFIITDASGSGSTIHMTGYFSGSYDYAGPVLPKKKVGNVEYYVIKTADDYETFRQIVATGNPYANAVLENNITVTKPIGIGSLEFQYRGIFDGQGHTVTLAMKDESNGGNSKGLFSNTESGTVIRNLKVSGEVSASDICGSIVGFATGTTIENCISDATVGGSGSHQGGLVGFSMGECFLENCAFIGSLQSSGQSSGLVGRNRQMVSIKSCYVAPKSIAGSGSMFTDQISEVETFKNNYQCTQLANGDSSPLGKDVRSTSITKDEVKNGMLCYKLNQNGRKGIVWYQNSDGYPYPFRTNNCKMIVSDDGGSTVDGNIVLCLHRKGFNDDHICSICGATEPVVTIEPLQDSGEDKEFSGDIFVGYLRYKLDTNKKTAIVKGTHHYDGDLHDGVKNRDATAVHIPETIIYNGVKYTVNNIGSKAFQHSIMQSCYIPKTVTRIEDDAFNHCSSLTDLHIADAPTALWMGENVDAWPDKSLFYQTQIKTVYVGRNISWDPDFTNAAPFDDVDNLLEVYFGPRVTLLGNAGYDDPNKSINDELWDNCDKIYKVYFMGDDASLGSSVNVQDCKGLGEATTYYINRDIDYSNYFTYSSGSATTEGCLDACEHVTYGPFVKSITKESFSAHTLNNNTTLKSVDFTNAFRLEEIGESAFAYCPDAVFAANPFKNCKTLRKIGSEAFTDCDGIHQLTIPRSVVSIDGQAFDDCDKLTSLVLEDGDTKIKFEGDAAFKACDHLAYIYQGRNYEYGGNTPFADCEEVTSVTIGPKVTKLNYNGYKGMEKLSITFLYSPDALTFEDTPAEVFYESKVRGMFIDRQLRDKNGEHIDWSEGDDAEKYSTKKNVENLSFGDHITAIPEHLFDHFSALKSVIIPASVTEIGKQAFIECGKLENLYILGDVHIGREAFARCTNLKHLFLMGQTAKVDELVFTGCNNIEEVVTGFLEASDNLSGSEEAFTQTAYANAHLVCAGDTKYHKIDFGSTTPWSLFKSKNRNSILSAKDYYIEDEEKKADYDHGYMPHSFTKDKYELVYAPFQMDSYYFGPKADIYKMSLTLVTGDENAAEGNATNATFEDVYSAGTGDKTYNIDDINFSKVDICNDMTLSRGVYLVNKKTDKPLSNMASYHNLYKQEKVAVNNKSFSANGKGTTTMSYSSDYPTPAALTAAGGENNTPYSFVCDGGVLKYVNGEYQPKVGEIVFSSPCESGKLIVFNIMDGENSILSSKIDLPFNKYLEGYSSFYAADYNYIAPSWCDVYIVTSAQEGESITMEEIKDRTITKGQAVLLKANKTAEEIKGGLTEYLTYATHGSSYSYDGNLLKGVDTDTPTNQLSSEGFVYVLSCNNNYQNAGFYRLTGDKIMPAGNAYLDPSGLSSQQLAKSCLFVFSDVATGIKAMQDAGSRTQNSDGTQAIYDLMGRRLKEAGFKGIYIMNGKKVVVK